MATLREVKPDPTFASKIRPKKLFDIGGLLLISG
jgi:hypothetical protein